MKLFLFSLFAGILLSAAEPVFAADTLVFDSTDHYLGACRFTNTSTWELSQDITVSKFQVWYKWDQGEVSLPVTVLKNGEQFLSFDAKRGDCDPYQTTWCNADYQVNKVFPKGTYSTQIPTNRQCLKPGGTGAVRLYTNDAPSVSATSAPTLTPTGIAQKVATPSLSESGSVVSKPAACSCNIAVTVGIAAATSSLLSVVITLLLRKK